MVPLYHFLELILSNGNIFDMKMKNLINNKMEKLIANSNL